MGGGHFNNEGNESRLDILTQFGLIKGITGLQSQLFNFSAVGEEAYLPPTQNRNLSFFSLQEISSGKNTYSSSIRFDNSHTQDQSSSGKARNFNGQNASLGMRRKISDPLTTFLSISYTERAPNFQELFANGGHVATGTFEEGNANLRKEKSFGIDLGFDYHRGPNGFVHVSLYAQKFKDYIALYDTGLPSGEPDFDNIFSYNQVNAIFYGFEFDSRMRVKNSDYFGILRADYVRAKETDNDSNLPRIAAPRLTMGVEKVKDRWTWDAEAQHYFEQYNTSSQEEFRTKNFTLLNAGFIYDIIQEQGKLSFFSRVKNILNIEARQHTSFLKEISPMPGRHLIVGLQYIH